MVKHQSVAAAGGSRTEATNRVYRSIELVVVHFKTGILSGWHGVPHSGQTAPVVARRSYPHRRQAVGGSDARRNLRHPARAKKTAPIRHAIPRPPNPHGISATAPSSANVKGYSAP